MPNYLGDFAEDATVRGCSNLTDKTNAGPITIGGTPSWAVYRKGSTTEITSGITVNVDFDTRTGMVDWSVDMSSSASYIAQADYYLAQVGSATVDGTSITGTILGEWSCENRFAEVDVVKVGGNAAANSGGRFEVDLSHVDGVALDVDSAQIGVKLISTANNAITNNSLADNAIGASKIANNAFTSSKFDSTAVDVFETAANTAIEFNELNHLLRDALPINLPVEDSLGDVLLQAIPTANENAAAAADAVWEEDIGSHSALGGGLVALACARIEILDADWSDGGRLDSILDGVPSAVWQRDVNANDNVPGSFGDYFGQMYVDTSTSIPAAIAGVPSAAANATAVWQNGTRSLTDKSGFILGATGLDSIPVTAPAGVASTFREMIVQGWRRMFKRTRYNKATGNIETYADNGTTVLTTQPVTADDSVEDVGAAT